jgi:hypothetical protein
LIFRAGLCKPEDVIHEEQHVLILFITKILCDRQARQADTQPGTRRLVHLAVDERRLRLGEIVGIDNLGLLHLVPKVIAFSSSFAYPSEH